MSEGVLFIEILLHSKEKSEDIMASLYPEAIESLFMSLIAPLALMLALWTGQTDERPAYACEADRMEQKFRAYRDRLSAFFTTRVNLMEHQSANATFPS